MSPSAPAAPRGPRSVLQRDDKPGSGRYKSKPQTHSRSAPTCGRGHAGAGAQRGDVGAGNASAERAASKRGARSPFPSAGLRSTPARPPESRVSPKNLMQPLLEGDREAAPRITPRETPATGCERPSAGTVRNNGRLEARPFQRPAPTWALTSRTSARCPWARSPQSQRADVRPPRKSVSGKDKVVEMIMGLMGVGLLRMQNSGHWRIISTESWHQI